MPGKRYAVRFGEAPPEPMVRTIPGSDGELLRRAMELVAELDDADFLPEEFKEEARALRRAWSREHGRQG